MSYCKPFKRGVSWRSQNFGANATIYGPHSGNDDAANIGTPVHAAGDGYIDWAGEFDDTYLDNLLWLLKMGGNILVLNCGASEPSFVYGHLHSFTVKRGDRVRKGQVIAYSGNTGTATTGAHLHTEAIPPGYALNSPMLGRVNPDIYLTEWPEDINTGSLSYAGTITPIQEDPLANFTADDIRQLVAEGIDGWSMNSRRLPDNRNLLDHLIQLRADIGAVPQKTSAAVLYNERVDGRNLFDWLKQLRSDVVGIQPGTIDVAGIAKALAEQLPKADAEALVDALAERLGGK